MELTLGKTFELAITRRSIIIRIRRFALDLCATPRVAGEPLIWAERSPPMSAQGRIGPLIWISDF